MTRQVSQPTQTGTLSLVATPIGNLEDITLRALRTLREAEVVLAEDTRHTRKLLNHYQIPARTRAFHAHSGPATIQRCLQDLGRGAHVAVVTDAGSPLISDPGAALVEAASAAGHRVESVPGPSAVIAALSVSAIPCDTFRFVGFLPRSGKRRRAVLGELARDRATTVLFEAPTRIHATLADLQDHCGPTRRVCVCRELTKLHETLIRGPLSQVQSEIGDRVRGEITLVVEGHAPDADSERTAADAESEAGEIDPRIDALLAEGMTPRDVVRRLQSETDRPRRALYARVQRRAGR